MLGVVVRPNRLPPTTVGVLDDLKPADRSGTARIAPAQMVERELDSLYVVVAAVEDAHVNPGVPVQDLSDFIGWLPGRMARIFSHARLLSY